MPPVARTLLALLFLTHAALPVAAQGLQPPEDIPKIMGLQPLAAKNCDLREALHQYVLGLLCEREDRLVEALTAWEKSAQLDPQAPAVYRGLISLFLALDRPADALAATQTVLRLDQQDYQTWFFHARQLRLLDKLKEAASALEHGLACPGIKDQHDLCQQMYHDLGVLYERLGEVEPAVTAYSKAAAQLESLDALADVESLNRQEIQLRIADLFERMGQGYLKLKRVDEAIAAFRKAQAKSPDGAGRLNFFLAQVCLDADRLPNALGYLDLYLRLLPQGTEAYELKIKLLQQQKRAAEIVPWLETASAQDHHNIGLKLLLAQQCGVAKRYAEAEKLYLALLEDTPKTNVYRGLFSLYQAQGQKQMLQALTLLDERLGQARKRQEMGSSQAPALVQALVGAFRDEPTLARDMLLAARQATTKELSPETLHFLAVMAENQKEWTDAEHFYRRCLERLTDPTSSTVIIGGLLRVLWRAHKHAEIADFCRQALQAPRGQQAVVFHSELARALVLLGQVDDCLAEVEKALQIAGDVEKSRLRLLRVRLLVQGERFPQAEQECQTLLKETILPGDQLDLYYLLSGVYQHSGQVTKAEEQLEHCLKLDPTNATFNNDLGYLWADQNKKLPEAEAMIRKAIEEDRQQKKNNLPFAATTPPEIQDNAAFLDSLGWVLYRRGQFEAAKKELERAIALPDSDDPVIWDHLGDVYQKLQLGAQAREAWEKALHFYEPDKGRKIDERYRELQNKLKTPETTIQSH